jgi:hypothetical protein
MGDTEKSKFYIIHKPGSCTRVCGECPRVLERLCEWRGARGVNYNRLSLYERRNGQTEHVESYKDPKDLARGVVDRLPPEQQTLDNVIFKGVREVEGGDDDLENLKNEVAAEICKVFLCLDEGPNLG